MGSDYYLGKPKLAPCEWIEIMIHDLIDEYSNKAEYYESDSFWNLGATEALEELLRRLGSDKT